MKTKTTFKTVLILSLFIFFTKTTTAQVGIGTTNPASGSMLDIVSSDKGLLIPRVGLTGTDDTTTITPSATEGLLVFNTNTAGSGINSVSEGFYYWNGIKWVRLQTNDKYWSIDGNDNITEGVNFIGTINDRNLDFKTDNTNRLRIPANANQLHAMENGTNIAPFYSWASDTNIGMWRPGTDQLALSAGGVEFLRLREGGTDELVINEEGVDVNTRIETSGNQNMLFVDGGTDRVGIKTNNPQTELHIAGNGNTVRIDELNASNNAHNIAVDPIPVYVNQYGDLELQPPLIQNFMPLNVVDFIAYPGVAITSNTGAGISADLYNTSITLTQESLVQVNYQMSVQLTMPNGEGPIVDGASRLYRSWVEVNGETTHIAYSTGTYTNNPSEQGGSFASGYYYLSGSGYVQLPAGTHNLKLRALGFGGEKILPPTTGFGYQIIFGQTAHDRFQVIVHR